MQFAHGTISGLQANCHPVSVKVLHKQLAACRGASNRATLQPLYVPPDLSTDGDHAQRMVANDDSDTAADLLHAAFTLVPTDA